jgi:hypothetical protein
VRAKGDWAVRLKHFEQWAVLYDDRYVITNTAIRNLVRTNTEDSHVMGCHAVSLAE